MRAVLGIDAAWTLTQPSGVALAVERTSGWHLIAAAASYQRFHALADSRQPAEECLSGSSPDAPALLAMVLRGRPVDLVAIDMPLAHSPIVGRVAPPIMMSLRPMVGANVERTRRALRGPATLVTT
jgi:hypothetical protein